jgi:hypothetical protein
MYAIHELGQWQYSYTSALCISTPLGGAMLEEGLAANKWLWPSPMTKIENSGPKTATGRS